MIDINYTATEAANYPMAAAKQGDSGIDLYTTEDVVLYPFTPTLLDHGICVECPEGYEWQLRPRSSTLTNRRVHIQLGTLDAAYRGNIKTVAMLMPRYDLMTESLDLTPIVLKAGEKVSQIVLNSIVPASSINMVKVDSLSETERGASGFGSTGL